MLDPAQPLSLLTSQAPGCRRRADTDVAEQDRQNNQIGQNQHSHTDTGNQRQVFDHLDIDDHQHGKANRI
ncbi:hypothetical protein D3C85_1786270 [compost metagenome]